MAKSICENCGAPFDQTPGKREKKFCKSSCRVSYCQKMKRKKNSALASNQANKIIKASIEAEKIHNGDLPEKNFDKEICSIVPVGDSLSMKKIRKNYPAKKAFKAPTDKHGAGKIVKEAVQKKEAKKAPAVSNFLEQRRKQKLG